MAFAKAVPSPVPTRDQRPGTCHLAADPYELAAIASDTAPPVPCTQPHQTETMWVATVTGPLAQPSRRPNSELLDHFLAPLCSDYQKVRAYVGASPEDSTWGIQSWVRFPTAAEWAAGDRTMLCQGSTTHYGPDGPTIDRSIGGIMATRASAMFRPCRARGAPVSCDQPHDSEATSPDVVFPAGPWPGAAMAAQMAAAACAPVTDAYLAAPLRDRPELVSQPDGPRQSDWAAGKRYADCWIANANGLLTTGTVRGGLR